MADEGRYQDEDKLNANLFQALIQDNDEQVIKLCNEIENGPLHKMTLHKSTVLHMACFLEKFELADKLLDIVFDKDFELFKNLYTPKNDWGSTILHDAATSNDGIPFVTKLLNRVPDLLMVRNRWGEPPLLQAIRFGNEDMFNFLVIEVDKYCELKNLTRNERLVFLQREDNMTILHMAILTRKFGVALHIAKRYPELYDVKDSHQMTALQMLACSPTAFESGTKLGPLEKLVYSFVSTDEQSTTAEAGKIRKDTNSIFTMIKKVREQKKGNEDALKLAQMLIKSDKSWKNTYIPLGEIAPNIGKTSPGKKKPTPVHGDSDKSGDESGEEGHSNKTTQTGNEQAPLHLAVKKGCIEIVKEILKEYPQAMDYLNHNQENLFHVAIKSRNKEIIETFIKEILVIRRGQLIAVDKEYNTIMHKVGYKPSILGTDNEAENTKSDGAHSKSTTKGEVLMDTTIKTPVGHLSDELKLLEKLERLCPDYLMNHRNKDNLTAQELFAKTNADLRGEAEEYLKRTAEHCTVVTILIATVAFAAAYTVPGGPDERTGLPVLLGQPLFLVFTVTDVLSLGFGLTAVVVFLTILTSQFRMKDFQKALPQRLLVGLTLLFLSVTMMMVSFAATIILTINTKQHWTKIALYIVAFFPVVIFMLSYIPFYQELLNILNYCIGSIGSIGSIGRSLSKPWRTEKPKDKDASSRDFDPQEV